MPPSIRAYEEGAAASRSDGGGLPCCAVWTDKASIAGTAIERSFRYMAFTQLKGLQAIGAKSCGDTIDEGGERYILLPVPFEIALRRIESSRDGAR
jgi:hypothetical protein